MSISVKLGQKIVSLRKKKNITQETLALEADISVSYMRAIDYGEANPTIQVLQKLADALDVPLSELLETSDTPTSA